jgi:hypothetical protein
MEGDEIRVRLVTYGGGEKHRSLNGKLLEKRDTGDTNLQSISTSYKNTRVSILHVYFRGYRNSTTRWKQLDGWN